MKLVGFNFTKIYIKKTKTSFENLKISTKLNITDFDKVESKILNNEDSIFSVRFTYEIGYEPKIAEIEFEGVILISVDSKMSEEMKNEWKKTKQLPEKIKFAIYNLILKKSNIKALSLEEEMNLPSHFNLPSLKPKKE